MKRPYTRLDDTRWLDMARREVSAADVQLTVALVAQVAASLADRSLGDDDSLTCISEAHSRYGDAAWRYLNAAHLAHGGHNRVGHHDIPDVPHPLRTALRASVATVRDSALHAGAQATASVDLHRLRSAVTAVRELLAAALPELFRGLEHPEQRLKRLRQASIPDGGGMQS